MFRYDNWGRTVRTGERRFTKMDFLETSNFKFKTYFCGSKNVSHYVLSFEKKERSQVQPLKD